MIFKFFFKQQITSAKTIETIVTTPSKHKSTGNLNVVSVRFSIENNRIKTNKVSTTFDKILLNSFHLFTITGYTKGNCAYFFKFSIVTICKQVVEEFF